MEVRSVSLKKQYKGIRPLGRLVSIKHDDLGVAFGSQGCKLLGCVPWERGAGKGLPQTPCLCLARVT